VQRAVSKAVAKTLPVLEWTGERYLPWIRNATMSYEHLHRYGFAGQFAKDKRVLDLGSGEGYGSNILAGSAEYVLGVDIDPACIQHASSKYSRKNLSFEIGTFARVPDQPDHSFDLIVCFEAIEHTADQDALLTEVKRLLKSDGLFIVSTPDKTAYRRESPTGNPFHIRELEMAEFHRLLANSFHETCLLGQRIFPVSSIWPLESAGPNTADELTARQGEIEFEFPSDEKRSPIYIIGMASDSADVIRAAGSVLIDSSMELMNETENTIHQLVKNNDECVEYRRQEVEWHQERISDLKQSVERLSSDIRFLQTCVHDATTELNTIYGSKSWAVIAKWCKYRDLAFPAGSTRRRLLQGILGGDHLKKGR
jgi:O-antigen biosynthesis protein